MGDFGPQQTALDQNNWSRTKITSDFGPADQNPHETISEILVRPDRNRPEQNSGDKLVPSELGAVVALEELLSCRKQLPFLLLLPRTGDPTQCCPDGVHMTKSAQGRLVIAMFPCTWK